MGNRTHPFLGLTLGLLPGVLMAQSQASTQASVASVMAGYSVVHGKLEALEFIGQLVIEKVTPESGHTLLALKGEKDNFSMLLKVSKETGLKNPLVVGQTLRVASESTGQALYASQELVAFIPNALGRSLVFQAPFPKPGSRALPKEPVVVVR